MAATASTLPTDDEIDAAILAALDVAGDVVSWANIRGSVPGAYWRKVERLVALHLNGRVDVWKLRGRTFVELPWPLAVRSRRRPATHDLAVSPRLRSAARPRLTASNVRSSVARQCPKTGPNTVDAAALG